MKRSAVVPILLGAAVFFAACVHAAVEVPAVDATVLEKLPGVQWQTDRELTELRQRVAAEPGNLELALQIAGRYIALARSESDPRYYGYAQAALANWWDDGRPPPAVLLLRATVRQANHDFSGALADLERVLQQQPKNAQAWFTLAMVAQVQGDYGRARAGCMGLERIERGIAPYLCHASVMSVSGRAQDAYQLLSEMPLADATEELQQWVQGLLAEISVRLGRPEQAEKHFKRALGAERRDPYVLRSYADFLLASGRAEAAWQLTREETRDDGLLLRAVLAAQALGKDEEIKQLGAELRDRYAASRLRASALHRRDEAWFALRLERDAERALQLAQENWAVQREPEDALLLATAARAADRAAAIEPVRQFMAQTKLEDARLDALLR